MYRRPGVNNWVADLDRTLNNNFFGTHVNDGNPIFDGIDCILAMFCLCLGSGSDRRSDLRGSVAPDPASVRIAVLWGAGLYATGPRRAGRAQPAG